MKLNKLRLVSVIFILSFVCIALSYSQSIAATYYVATTGGDNISCGATDSACATLQYVLDNKVNAGDTIKIKAGTYAMGAKTININNPIKHTNITITADDINNKPLLSFSWVSINIRIGFYDVNNPANDISVSGVTLSYLKIQSGAARTGTWGTSIRVDRESNPVTIDNCEIYNGMTGIAINTGKNVTVSNNKVYTMGQYETSPDLAAGSGVGIGIYNFPNENGRNSIATGWNEKIYIYNNEVYDVAEDGVINMQSHYRYVEIAYNNLHDNYEEGIDNKEGQFFRIHHNKLHDNWGDGIGSNNSQPSTDFEVWDNEIYNNGWYGLLVQGGANDQKNWKIWNNLIYKNAKNPATWGADGVSLAGSGHEFYHNVVYDNTVPGSQSNAGLRGSGIIKNNIFYNNAGRSSGNIATSVTGTIENNYVFPISPGKTGNNAVTNSNPMFKNPAGNDFSLLSGSSLIDAGTNVGITEDYAGKARPLGKGYDIGAFEYDPGSSKRPSPPQNLHVVQN